MAKRRTTVVITVLVSLAIALAGYGVRRYFSYESGLREAKEAYVIPKSEMETATCEVPAAITASTASTVSTASTPTPFTPAARLSLPTFWYLASIQVNRTTEDRDQTR